MRIIKLILTLSVLSFYSSVSANEDTFKVWLKDFKIYALKNDVSEVTFDKAMHGVKFLPKVNIPVSP